MIQRRDQIKARIVELKEEKLRNEQEFAKVSSRLVEAIKMKFSGLLISCCMKDLTLNGQI